jgi:pseudaminic acid cytidylyltransferase
MKKKFICIIPARGGSKRIPNKNIIKFYGYPIISYAIKTALKSKLFNQIFVSTDSKKIKKISENFGANVPFIRSKKLSSDKALIKDVIINFLQELTVVKDSVDFHCVVFPMTPLLNFNDLIKAYRKLKKNLKADGISCVTKYDTHPQRSIAIRSNYIEYEWKKFEFKMSNKLEQLYFDTGYFYIYRTKNYLKKKGKNLKILPYEIPTDKAVDINTPDDIKKTKKIYKKLLNKIT